MSLLFLSPFFPFALCIDFLVVTNGLSLSDCMRVGFA